MASNMHMSLPIRKKDQENLEEVDGFVNLSRYRRERPGTRSYTVMTEPVEIPNDPCLMRDKSRWHATISEVPSHGDDTMDLEWEKVDWVMIAVEEYSSDGKKENAVRKG